MPELRLVGVTDFHSETGTEGGHWAFQDHRAMHDQSQWLPGKRCPWGGKYCPADRAATEHDPNPEHWDQVGQWILRTRDQIVIYDDFDPTTVVYEGEISLVRYEPFTESVGRIWIHADQVGQDREAWATLFLRRHPAVLIKFDPSADDIDRDHRLQTKVFWPQLSDESPVGAVSQRRPERRAMLPVVRLEGRKGELADRLFELGAIQINFNQKWKLKSGLMSPLYCNLRTPDNPKPGPIDKIALRMGGDLLAERVYSAPSSESAIPAFNIVAGIPNAGDPWAYAFVSAPSQDRDAPGLIRLGKQGEGDLRHVTGVVSGPAYPGNLVLLIDDLVTGADSKFEAIAAIEEALMMVGSILVLVDREQGGVAQLKAAGYQLYAIFTITELIGHYVATDAITLEVGERVLEFIHAHQL